MGREVLAIFIMCSRDIEQTASTSFVDVVLDYSYLDTLYKISVFGFPFSIFQFLFILSVYSKSSLNSDLPSCSSGPHI